MMWLPRMPAMQSNEKPLSWQVWNFTSASGCRKNTKNLVSVDSKAALHTKAMVIDRKAVYIGSFNLDPRSSDINTEATIYIENPELAEQVIAYMDEGVRPENSYRVLLDEDDDLVWVTENEGHEIRYHKEPETSFWQRFVSGFIKILPVEGQL